MNSTLEYILNKYHFDPNSNFKMPRSIGESRKGGLTGLFRELDFKVGAEIGVEQGLFSEWICKDNPEVKLFCVDAWQAYRRYRDHVNQSKLDTFYEEAKARLSPYNCEFIRKFSMDAVKDFEPNSLDFVFIDANHDFEFVVNDIIYWSKIVKPGGIVSGHDYRGEDKDPNIPFHVIQAINAYTNSYKIKPWFVFTKSKSPSWMFVKH
jgi:hypothetical protein